MSGRRLSVAIMAHPKRERWIPYLLDRLPTDTTVVWDERNDRWDTGRRAMLAFAPDATHHLVVQDDAILCRDLAPGLERALAVVPDNPIALYTGRVRPNHALVADLTEHAMRAGRSWIAMEGPWWGVAVCVPTCHIPAMVAWGDGHPEIANYDRRMSRYFASVGVECYYTVPSLVSHRTGDDNPSLVPGRSNGPTRVAFWFVGEDSSALDVQWTADPVRRNPWRRGTYEGEIRYWCSTCHFDTPAERAMRQHYVRQHQGAFLGPVDFLAFDPPGIARLEPVWRALPEEMRGTFYVLTRQYGRHITVAAEQVRKPDAERTLNANTRERLVVVSDERALIYAGIRPALTLPDGPPAQAARWLGEHVYLVRNGAEVAA